ncbi:TOBE domain-containing protein [Halomarina litorea]|uniref:TOBE domain-containing protein n=1 Tax=Halomarina litorea TaxID=2961595 RepID=UPI0020C35AF9|nr:TOBE domain-containing protein [Halomarina sp. BCD28]
MDPGFEARLRAGDVTFTPRDATLLRAIGETGSLNAAAGELGRSYARAHGRLGELETAFGSLVERHRGGSGGGGSHLTPDAERLLARFDRLQSAFSGTASAEETVLTGRVTGREGELATVETPAGTVRALAPPAADRVQVAVRADTVTLHATSEVPDEDATSARNRFAGTVVDIDRGEAVALVSVDVGGDRPLAALVTMESVERLGLAPGREVVATTKATATRATPAPAVDE